MTIQGSMCASAVTDQDLTKYFHSDGSYSSASEQQFIIPYKLFSGKYNQVLFNLQKHDHITNSERRLLSELSFFCCKRCFNPTQEMAGPASRFFSTL